ncbi:hypothetical protein VTK73DRAFT_8492 [Phialemonium thermophilum]|uniref:HIT-type domain-containing protein n=1 Tax=Phialemonium thermophilum TaxID=223376 RepID=A0ABR3XNM1_9PEZI
MSDTVLTSLCTICHTDPPKYKCPRCGARTCSLPCVRRHKAWASCSGERDPAAFIPREHLRSEAGIDHDYNFLSRIERARERFEREAASRGAVLSSGRGHGVVGNNKRFEKVWHGDQLQHIPVMGGGRGGGRFQDNGGPRRPGPEARFLSGPDKQVRRRLRAHDIEVLQMPKGLTRQRQNKTSWNRRTNTINWQVEWLVMDPAQLNLVSTSTEGQPLQILHKALDEQPLCQSFSNSIEWYSAGVKRAREADDEDNAVADESRPRKRSKTSRNKRTKAQGCTDSLLSSQETATLAWPATEYTLQSSLHSTWSETSTSSCVPTSKGEKQELLARWQYFLLKPTSSKDGTRHIIPVSSRESLLEVLSGRTVVEFPTIYVMAPELQPPPEFSLASTERRERIANSADDSEHNDKGRPYPGRKQGQTSRERLAPSSRRKSVSPEADSVEEGQIGNNEEQPDVSNANAEVSSENSTESSTDTDTDSLDHERSNFLCPAEASSAINKGLVDYGSSSDSDGADNE